MIALDKSKVFDLSLKAQLLLGFLYFQIGCYDPVNVIELNKEVLTNIDFFIDYSVKKRSHSKSISKKKYISFSFIIT